MSNQYVTLHQQDFISIGQHNETKEIVLWFDDGGGPAGEDNQEAALKLLNALASAFNKELSDTWQPMHTMPVGRFLIGVWEGEWKDPKREFRVYEASRSSPNGWFVWGRSYRTAEGEAYEVVGWKPSPQPPKE